MSTCNFKIGEMVLCVEPDSFGNYLKGRRYCVTGVPYGNGSTYEYVSLRGEDGQVRAMWTHRFVRVTQKEFTDEEYERLLV